MCAQQFLFHPPSGHITQRFQLGGGYLVDETRLVGKVAQQPRNIRQQQQRSRAERRRNHRRPTITINVQRLTRATDRQWRDNRQIPSIQQQPKQRGVDVFNRARPIIADDPLSAVFDDANHAFAVAA